MNKDILKQIFQYFYIDSLEPMREVNSEWNELIKEMKMKIFWIPPKDFKPILSEESHTCLHLRYKMNPFDIKNFYSLSDTRRLEKLNKYVKVGNVATIGGGIELPCWSCVVVDIKPDGLTVIEPLVYEDHGNLILGVDTKDSKTRKKWKKIPKIDRKDCRCNYFGNRDWKGKGACWGSCACREEKLYSICKGYQSKFYQKGFVHFESFDDYFSIENGLLGLRYMLGYYDQLDYFDDCYESYCKV